MKRILDVLAFALYPAVLLVGLAAAVALLLGRVTLYVFLAPWTTGAAIGWALYFIVRERETRKAQKLFDYLPTSAHNLNSDPNGPQQVVITRNSGEQLMITLPAGYDPAEDGGAAMLEAACPDLPKAMRVRLAGAVNRRFDEEEQ